MQQLHFLCILGHSLLLFVVVVTIALQHVVTWCVYDHLFVCAVLCSRQRAEEEEREAQREQKFGRSRRFTSTHQFAGEAGTSSHHQQPQQRRRRDFLGYYKALGISLEEAGAAVGDRWLAHLQPLLCTLQMCSKAQLTHTGYKRLFVARCSHKLLAPLLQSVLSDAIDELDQPLLPQLPPLSCCSHHSAPVLAQQHIIVNALSLVHALACLGYDSVLVNTCRGEHQLGLHQVSL